MDDSSQRQSRHYDEIAEGYEAHYSDEWSLRYRVEFQLEPLLRGVDVRGARVLDAMCGSGQVAGFLASRGAHVTGLDVSAAVIAQFRAKHPSLDAVQASIFESGFPDEHFDHVFVDGGLHHVHPHVEAAVAEIHRILKPGGFFCFSEPHAHALPDLARRLWYRLDPLFESNEHAIDVPALLAANREWFEPVSIRYCGGLAYLLVFNSMVFRIPARLKRVYSPALLRLEHPLGRLQGPRTSCFVLAQWRKRRG